MRCYDGCPDSRLQAVFDAQDKADARLKTICPEAHCIYFPSPGYWQIWVGFEPLRGWKHAKHFTEKLDALNDAIQVLSV